MTAPKPVAERGGEVYTAPGLAALVYVTDDVWVGVRPDGGMRQYTEATVMCMAGMTKLLPAPWVSLRSLFAGKPYLTISDLKVEPGPLDAGNPEHLRRVVKFVMSCYIGEDDDVIAEQIRALATSLHARADRLDREHAEAEQDAAARKRAEEYAGTRWEFDTTNYWECVDAYLAGARATRAAEAGA